VSFRHYNQSWISISTYQNYPWNSPWCVVDSKIISNWPINKIEKVIKNMHITICMPKCSLGALAMSSNWIICYNHLWGNKSSHSPYPTLTNTQIFLMTFVRKNEQQIKEEGKKHIKRKRKKEENFPYSCYSFLVLW